MATALAQRLNMAPPADGCLLNVPMTAAELRPIVEWIKEQFPQLGFCPLNEKPLPLAKAKSPWRFFGLGSAEDVTVDDDLTAAVAVVVDLLHKSPRGISTPKLPSAVWCTATSQCCRS
jgi:hypothetical protein